MAADRVERRIELRARRDDVWAAITLAERLSSWFGGDAEIELRPGGRLTVTGGGRVRRGLVEAVEPPSRFSFRWLPEPGEPTGLRTRVELTLEECGVGTRLTVVERSLWAAEDAGEPDDAMAGVR
jgi:uncharacterized protein YndB with AHSA1/START domain